MRRASTRPALVIALTVTAAVLVGCIAGDEPSPRVIDGAFPPRVDLPALPFRVTDRTGLIRAVAAVNPGDVIEGVSQVPGRDDALYLLWIGGACDRQVHLVFDWQAEPTLELTTEHDLGGCRMVGIDRNLMIEFTRPVDAATVVYGTLD